MRSFSYYGGRGDLVTYTEYDGAGREWKQYLPIPSAGNGSIVPTTDFTNVHSIYSQEGRPYNEAIIEASPLNRVLGNKGPGLAWGEKRTTIAYDTNTSEDAVVFFFVNESNMHIPEHTHPLSNRIFSVLN